MNACLPCRKVKMKCRSGGPTVSACERCARKSLDCVFQKHRRGRKPGTRISKRTPELPMPAAAAAAAADAAYPPLPERRTPEDPPALPGQQIPEGVPVAEPDNLQPSGVLNREAMRGKFSLRHILSTNDGDLLEPPPNDAAAAIRGEDPVWLGFVTVSMAKTLFENFIVVLNPYICQLDPLLHTFAHVRQKSSFLFSAILAMAAKAFSPILYDKLHEHAQFLFTESFRCGSKSAETAQAILILTYWKQPQDTRAWTSLGYVIRMCTDMGWHRLAAPCFSSSSQSSQITTTTTTTTTNIRTEAERRELRNMERTWYVLFVYDRSMSLQTGRPWMIERNAFVESIEAWCNDPMATPNDILLGAFVSLRLVASAIFTLLVPKLQRSERLSTQNIDPLLSLVNGSIERWEHRWIQAVEASDKESCRVFLTRFYGTHLRLQLFSLPLQDMLAASCESGASLNLEILWTAYSSAMDMLQLIPRYASYLYFAQDSIHVMTAYSAAFLVKLLLSAPNSIVAPIESNTVNAIRAAASVFSQPSGPPGSSCELQARFLNKIVSNLLRKRQERSYSSMQSDGNSSSSVGDQSPHQQQQHQHQHQHHHHYHHQANVARESRPHGDSGRLHLQPVVDAAMPPELAAFQQGELDLFFTNDDTWADIFAGAVFNTQHSVFLA